MALQLSGRLYHIMGWFYQGLLEEILSIHKIALIRKTSCSSRKNIVNNFGGTLNASKTFLSMSSSQNREMTIMLNFMTVQITQPRPSQKSCAKGDSCKRIRMKDGIYMRIQLKRPSNGNQLVKTRGIQTPSLQKEVCIQLNHPQLTRLSQLTQREDWKV